jgi:hypothetical protein
LVGWLVKLYSGPLRFQTLATYSLPSTGLCFIAIQFSKSNEVHKIIMHVNQKEVGNLLLWAIVGITRSFAWTD